ncbi:B-cell scaffold protein with ankyrin repeats [Anabarilius grahami]|uniref:B-cell scaffold protein with ankyrin repeats n=1 Tax=Anabarilius grahami TaxID=495550 RepID=A0A3N0YIE3_ANAGA|nr:B-cell scaffold protein with ankyrin repeats [Anabarilius grahami]
MGKKGDLSNFERGMVVGARRAGLSISQSAQLLGFSRTTISRVYKEWCEKGKTSSMRQSCGRKCLVDARGQRRMGRLIQADRRATLTEITTRYNRGMQQSICEATTRTTLRRMGYNSRRPHRVPLISTTNRKKRLQFARAHQNWTVEDWKNVAWSDESRFLLRHSDGRVRIWRKQNENMDPSCLVTTVQADNLQVAYPNEEHQNSEDENVYTPLGKDEEEYDTILTSSSSGAIVNRPPAPTPRPDSLPTPDDKTPFIAQARQRTSISSTYDTFVPSQPPGLDELIKLQEEVKMGTLSIDDALDQFNDWQRFQKGTDSVQQEKIQQLRESIVSNREDDESVYDKISIIHHTPTASANECRRSSQQLDTEFYSKPLKGQNTKNKAIAHPIVPVDLSVPYGSLIVSKDTNKRLGESNYRIYVTLHLTLLNKSQGCCQGTSGWHRRSRDYHSSYSIPQRAKQHLVQGQRYTGHCGPCRPLACLIKGQKRPLECGCTLGSVAESPCAGALGRLAALFPNAWPLCSSAQARPSCPRPQGCSNSAAEKESEKSEKYSHVAVFKSNPPPSFQRCYRNSQSETVVPMRLAWVSVAQVECIWNNGPSGCASGAHFNHTVSTVLADGDIEWAAGKPPDLIYGGQKWTIEGRMLQICSHADFF